MAAKNPNPTRITDAMWWLWLACHGLIPGVRLGGIYADKSGFHNTVNANLAKWPGNYSVRHAIDRKAPKDKARAIDLTMNATWMRIITQRLLDGVARRDQRLRCVKEFYGTINGRTVVGRIKDSETGEWRTATSDDSHTWHEHMGFHTPFVDDMDSLEGVFSLLSGESWEAWIARKYGGHLPGLPVSGIPDPTLREGASGAGVLALQVYLNGVIGAGLVEDGEFGPATTAAVRELQRRAAITIDGIYGEDSADALRSLLEDDMQLTDKIDLRTGGEVEYSAKTTTVGGILTSTNYYVLQSRNKLAAEQAVQRALLNQLVAKQSGLTEAQVTAAVAEGVRQAMPSPEELAAAVAAAVDHELDVDAAAEALRQVLRTGVGE